MRVLVLNWRDVRSPRAGGAEVVTHEVAKRLVAAGHEVVLFTSQPDGLPERDEVDGVTLVRRGSELTTRLRAPRFARAGRFDVMVEEINTLPYFAPLWSRAPVVLFMHQLAREVWFYESPKPVAPLGYAAEPVYLQAYRSCPKVTVSASTRDDLLGLGLGGPVHVIPEAVSAPALDRLPPKAPAPRLAWVARLVPSKRPDHAVRALAALRERRPDATLTLAGEGPERARIERLAAELGVGSALTLAGRVDEAQKLAILQSASVLIACSAREGWGLTVTEAGRLGTPAVAYDVAGLRDSIVDGRTGVLTRQSPEALADAVHELVADEQRYMRLREGAWSLARELTWDRTASAFERVLRGVAP
jgi:glycosyltransferase involved in cell wall biosynthesis